MSKGACRSVYRAFILRPRWPFYLDTLLVHQLMHDTCGGDGGDGSDGGWFVMYCTCVSYMRIHVCSVLYYPYSYEYVHTCMNMIHAISQSKIII